MTADADPCTYDKLRRDEGDLGCSRDRAHQRQERQWMHECSRGRGDGAGMVRSR